MTIDLAPGSEETLAFIDSMEPMPHEVHVLHVVDQVGGDPDPKAFATRDRIRAIMPTSLKERAFIEVCFGSVGEEILRKAEETDPLFIVMSAHKKSVLRRMMSGDRAFEVLHGSPCPVWFLRP